jgi:predicted O-methyltransferase YrrM
MSLIGRLKQSLPPGLKSRLRETRHRLGTLRNKARGYLGRPNVYQLGTPERVGIVFDNPSEMNVSERLFLYSLIRGTRPHRVLEIGSRHGGSASIIAAALEDIDPRHPGRVFGVDPGPEITVPERKFFGRFELIVEPSPQGITTARQKAGGPFDFALVDGLHIYSQVKQDLLGVLPHMADESYILLHDAFHYGLSKAISEVVATESRLFDCGYPCGKPWMEHPLLAYGGLRMLRFSERAVTDPQRFIEREAELLHKAAPPIDDDLADHDPFWHCRAIEPCAYCRKTGQGKAAPKT